MTGESCSFMSAVRRSLLRGVVLILCTAGAVVSLGLLQAHVAPEQAVLSQFCAAASETAPGCSAALESRWSAVTLPLPRPTRDFRISIRQITIPVAFFGAAYFVFLAAWFSVVGTARSSERWARVPWAIARFGGLASLIFVGLMAFTTTPWCVLCLVVHAINAVLVTAIWRATRTVTPTSARLPTRGWRDAAIAMSVATVAVTAVWGMYRQARIHRHHIDRLTSRAAIVDGLRNDPEFLLREFAAQPLVLQDALPLRPSERLSDDQSVLVVFSDYECPACRCHAIGVRERMKHQFLDRIRVVMRHYPLCRTCNPAGNDGHSNACDAAYAAEAARLQGGEAAFLRMHDALFAHADSLGPALYVELAGALGLDADRLVRDMASDAVRDIVAEDVALGTRLGVVGTPTMVLDGRAMPSVCDTNAFWRAYADQRTETLRLASAAPGDGVTSLPPAVCTSDHERISREDRLP